MTPEKKSPNSAEQREDCTTARTNSISEDRRDLKTRKRIHHCERNNGLAIYYCYLALTAGIAGENFNR